jgi:hypothetical protein
MARGVAERSVRKTPKSALRDVALRPAQGVSKDALVRFNLDLAVHLTMSDADNYMLA